MTKKEIELIEKLIDAKIEMSNRINWPNANIPLEKKINQIKKELEE